MKQKISSKTMKNRELCLIINNLFAQDFMSEKIKQYTFHPGGVHYLVL
jgi:hypothetical protein